MATSKQIRISIVSALNAAGIEATKQQVEAMSRHVSSTMAKSAKQSGLSWTDFFFKWKIMIGGAKAAWNALRSAMSSSFRFETLTAQFRYLVGNLDNARAHMAELKKLGDTPPFDVEQFARASKQMMVMTDGALGYTKSLKAIGDAAAACGVPIEQMGHAVSRLYAFIRDGQPLSRAVMELRNMGVISPEVAQRLQDMQKAGATNAEIWAEVEKSLNRFNGAMEAANKTGEGFVSSIGTKFTNIWRQFTDELNKGVLPALEQVDKAIGKVEKSGAANKVGKAVTDTVKKNFSVKGILGGLFDWVTGVPVFKTSKMLGGLDRIRNTKFGKFVFGENTIFRCTAIG